jgi:streptogramin lyase
MSRASLVQNKGFWPAALVLAALCWPGASAAATPIPGPDVPAAPNFIGHPATQRPVSAPKPPQNPFMASNQRSELHVDAYQSDANRWAGPLGRHMQRASTYQNSDCASVGFDRENRVITTCIGLQGPTLFMFDPHNLNTLARLTLPGRTLGLSQNPLTDFSSGGYFYLDNQARAVIPTTTRHVWVVAETGGTQHPGFVVQHDFDLTSTLQQGDEILSVLPDWSGRIWFASRNGVVGTITPTSGAIRTDDTRETIGNSFASDELGGVYVVTDGALYRFAAGRDGVPRVTWRATYPNDGTTKPGQTEVGSGTTPTVMTNGDVAITDNANPIDIDVFRRSNGSGVCRASLFSKGQSDTDQSLVAAGNALVAENNYGYSSPAATEEGRTTVGGLERVDVNRANNSCREVWHSDEIAPSVVPKASLLNGLVYTYTLPGGNTSDPWYLTALDFRTGATVYKFRLGSGLGYNNNYAPVTIGPDGTAYVGVLGGLALARDATPPAQTVTSQQGRPRLHLRVGLGGPRICTAARVRVTVGGPGQGSIRAVSFRLGGRLLARVHRAPFSRRIRLAGNHGPVRLRAVITLRSGAHLTLRRRIRGCRPTVPVFTG